MTSGCGPGWLSGADVPAWSEPLVIPDSGVRCPEADPAAKREFSRTTPPPAPDTVTADGRPALSIDAWKVKTDELRAAVARKNRAGRRVLTDYERCRSGSAPATS